MHVSFPVCLAAHAVIKEINIVMWSVVVKVGWRIPVCNGHCHRTVWQADWQRKRNRDQNIQVMMGWEGKERDTERQGYKVICAVSWNVFFF